MTEDFTTKDILKDIREALVLMSQITRPNNSKKWRMHNK